MKKYINSDLAIENRGSFNAEGIFQNEYEEEEKNGNIICKLKISNNELSEKYGKPIGTYTTVFCDKIWAMDGISLDLLSYTVADELKARLDFFCKGKKYSERSVLVVGLGNSEITADAIGPMTVSKLTATRHIYNMLNEKNIYNVSTLIPGVLSQTGIEVVEIIRSVSQNIDPNVVIAVDALAARSCERLGATVQISDIGISPGSGIGNMRKAINKQTIGYNVISLGVPTVVDSATLVYDALSKAGINDIDESLNKILNNEKDFFVNPKESDMITKNASDVLANALNIVFGLYS